MATVTCHETKHKTYNVPVGRCALHTSAYVPNFVDMHHNALIYLCESNKKEEPSKISDIKKNAYTLFLVHLTYFSQGNHNSCIISSLASALHYMGDELALEYTIRRKQKSLYFIHN